MSGAERKSKRSSIGDTKRFYVWRLCIVLVLVFRFMVITVYCGEDVRTAYEQLEANGFPAGLLPRTVTHYDLETDGMFTLHLQGKCNVHIPNEFPVVYSKTISGVLSYGSLRDLTGISVKAYYIWWALTAITVNNNSLVFEVGLLSAKYPLANFDESPTCGNPDLLLSI